MKLNWMILLGSLLVVAGLANSFLGARQTASPFDVADGEVVQASDNSFDIPLLRGSPPEVAPPVPRLEALSSSQPAQAGAERPAGLVPDRLVIPAINLDAPIVPTQVKKIEYQGQTYYQWLAPNQPAAGWHDSSALLGEPGNTVLNGHHNVYGKVFKDLVDLHEGDLIEVYSGNVLFKYQVALAMLLPERYRSLSVRLENARWILPTQDERLTLITCWPPESNTHRVIIVALPVK